MHLVEEPSVVDPTYIEDFLLTYRTFLSNPMEVGKKLLEWFQVDTLRDTVSLLALVVVFWQDVSNSSTCTPLGCLCFYKNQGKVHDAYHSFVFLHVNLKK